jgi:hypothetical protein
MHSKFFREGRERLSSVASFIGVIYNLVPAAPGRADGVSAIEVSSSPIEFVRAECSCSCRCCMAGGDEGSRGWHGSRADPGTRKKTALVEDLTPVNGPRDFPDRSRARCSADDPTSRIVSLPLGMRGAMAFSQQLLSGAPTRFNLDRLRLHARPVFLWVEPSQLRKGRVLLASCQCESCWRSDRQKRSSKALPRALYSAGGLEFIQNLGKTIT